MLFSCRLSCHRLTRPAAVRYRFKCAEPANAAFNCYPVFGGDPVYLPFDGRDGQRSPVDKLPQFDTGGRSIDGIRCEPVAAPTSGKYVDIAGAPPAPPQSNTLPGGGADASTVLNLAS